MDTDRIRSTIYPNSVWSNAWTNGRCAPANTRLVIRSYPEQLTGGLHNRAVPDRFSPECEPTRHQVGYRMAHRALCPEDSGLREQLLDI